MMTRRRAPWRASPPTPRAMGMAATVFDATTTILGSIPLCRARRGRRQPCRAASQRTEPQREREGKSSQTKTTHMLRRHNKLGSLAYNGDPPSLVNYSGYAGQASAEN